MRWLFPLPLLFKQLLQTSFPHQFTINQAMAANPEINSSFLFLFLQIYNDAIISLIILFCFAELKPLPCLSSQPWRRRCPVLVAVPTAPPSLLLTPCSCYFSAGAVSLFQVRRPNLPPHPSNALRSSLLPARHAEPRLPPRRRHLYFHLIPQDPATQAQRSTH